MRLTIHLIAVLALFQQQPKAQAPEILAHFHAISLSDTLHIEVTVEYESSIKRDTIPNDKFFSNIPIVLLNQIDYIADSAQAQVYGRGKFALTDSVTAYWVEIRQFWFQHHSIFLFNNAQKAFTDRVTVAEFYGGDGGQVLLGSWLFDYDGDGQTDLVRREIQHSMIPGEEDVVERTDHTAMLFLWKNDRFVETPLQDMAAIVKRFPIRSDWD